MLCSQCGEDKPQDEFYAKRRHCKECERAKQRAYNRANRDKIYANGAEYRARNRESLRERQFQRSYGITWADRDAMLDAQGGACANPGCRTPDPGGRGWHVDHDHACCPERARSCGECIRGVLCGSCNLMLGNARDNEDILAGAIQYLRDNRSTRTAAPAA